MRILVTGINGYIGTVLGDVLQKAGFDVVGLDTNFYADAWLYDLPGYQKPDVIFKDIRKVNKNDLNGITAIIHLAELSNDPLGENDPEITYKINHEGTVNLAKLAKAVGIKRFVYFSSCSVYGASDNIAEEASPTNPLTAYAKSKVLNENFLLKISDENFTPIIFRNATVYGASPRLRFDLAVNNLAGLAFTTGEIKMDSDGTPWRPFVHVRDVCQAVVLALKAPLPQIKNEIINIGNTKSNYQIKEIAEIVRKVFPGCSVVLNPNGADKRNYRVNFDKIKKVFPEFECQYDVEKGTKELLDVFKSANLSEADFFSKKYIRLKQIKFLRDKGKLDSDFYWKRQ